MTSTTSCNVQLNAIYPERIKCKMTRHKASPKKIQWIHTRTGWLDETRNVNKTNLSAVKIIAIGRQYPIQAYFDVFRLLNNKHALAVTNDFDIVSPLKSLLLWAMFSGTHVLGYRDESSYTKTLYDRILQHDARRDKIRKFVFIVRNLCLLQNSVDIVCWQVSDSDFSLIPIKLILITFH